MASNTSDENNITESHSVEAFMAMVEDSIKQDRLMVALFFANWSVPSKVMYDTLVQLGKAHPEVMFCKVNTEACQDITGRLGVRIVPTTVLILKGKDVERVKSTATFNVLEQKLLLHLAK